MKNIITASLLLPAVLLNPVNAWSNEWSGNLSMQASIFTKDGISSSQFEQYASVSLQPEWFHEWDEGKQSLTFVPFARIDNHDEERSHADIRELSWLKVFPESELRIGLRKVFWGVTESQHLVDIINQTDLVEGPDGEEKLGQPMINYAFINEWGTVDIFILPYFRERTFPGLNGRLRTPLVVDTSNPLYESSDKEKHIDSAIRWQHSLGDWDIGLSYFDGTSREPDLIPILDSFGNPIALRPVYNLVKQAGLDLQVTKEAWLWKLEVINRKINGDSYNAATGGFEYTFFGVLDTASDIGLVMEYSYDDRKEYATTTFDDDLMLGLRWTQNDENDTTLLLGVVADLNNSERLYSVEASRRIGESWKLNLEARVFSGITDSNSLLYSARKDDFIQIELGYYF